MKEVYTVSQINAYIKNMLQRDMLLNRISIQGEVSNCKYHTSGHIYFTLKDEAGQLPCVMFAGQRGGLAFRLSEGQKVIVSGSISVYERDGRYQMYAAQITLAGAGLLYEQFERLKARLLTEGLFDKAHKKPLPPFPRKIGIVTASGGAALQDIRNIAYRRNPCIQLILCPAQVQGQGAAKSVANSIKRLDAHGVDVIIVARGGGSIEDLWAFNEEIVARAAYECGTPLVSGVGHETDVTILDYVADLRTPTPSAAAELTVYERAALLAELGGRHAELARKIAEKIRQKKQEAEGRKLHLSYLSPRYQVMQKRNQIKEKEDALKRQMKDRMTEKRHRLSVAVERFKGASPLNRLNQGYSYVSDEGGRCVTSIRDVKERDKLIISVKDGDIFAEVKGKKSGKRIEDGAENAEMRDGWRLGRK